MTQLYLRAYSHGTAADRVFGRVVTSLRRYGIEADWGPFPLNSNYGSQVTVCHDDWVNGLDVQERPILGEDNLSRADRLRILAQAGVPVVPWCAPPNVQIASTLLTRWDVDRIILKRDKSSSRRGIKLIRRGDLVEFRPSTDVFMKIADESPYTYKVDFFYDHIINAYVINTPPVDDPAFTTRNLDFSQIPFDHGLKRIIKLIGSTLYGYGCGYGSADFMILDRKLALIEVNISGIATAETWDRWGEHYSLAYAEALLHFIKTERSVPTLREFRARALAIGVGREGPCLQARMV